MSTLHIVCPSCQAVNRIPVERLKQSPACGRCKAQVVPDNPVELTDANFNRFIAKTELPVIVDFWADWCGPCKMMAPAFSQVAKQSHGQAIFAKVDTQANPGISQQFGIRSIPSLLVFKNGREITRQAGAMPANSLQQWVVQSIR